MKSLLKITLQVLFVAFAGVLLCLLLPPMLIIEFFLVFLGAFIIARMGIFAAQEAAELLDLMDEHKFEHEIRELKLQKLKQQPLLLNSRCRWMTRSRPFHR